jgi:DnaK suppressor protein
MALRKEKIESIREHLLTRREALRTEVRQVTEGMINDDTVFSDAVDQASAETDKSLAVQVQNREREEIREIEEALRRIEQGSFGTCESCGDEISEARMSAYPETTLCIVCKAELESERNRYSGR